MNDIVERLRYAEHVIDERVMKVMDDGADEIESLRHKLEMAEACLAGDNALIVGLKNDIADKDAEIERLKSTPPEKREDLYCVISELCTQVRDMKANYKSALEAEQVRFRQLAASQSRERQLREALSAFLYRFPESSVAKDAIAAPTDTTALQAMIAKTGEVMRERAIAEMSDIAPYEHRVEKLNAIPPITLDDLK